MPTSLSSSPSAQCHFPEHEKILTWQIACSYVDTEARRAAMASPLEELGRQAAA